MLDFRAFQAMIIFMVIGLANRWFQPLTHVSGCGVVPVPLEIAGFPVNADNAKNANDSGLPWHNLRHSLFAGRFVNLRASGEGASHG